MTWFEKLTGITETSPEHVRRNIVIDGDKMKSLANGKEMIWGALEIPSLAELRARVADIKNPGGRIHVRELVANVQTLHTDAANAGALFQVASQFNLLEMKCPNCTPEDGIGIYEDDPTQGPACAIACGAGTIYRNYFVPVNGEIGQSRDNQIDCLGEIASALNNSNQRLWKMQNGYAFATRAGLEEISKRLRAANTNELDEIRKLLRIGVQWNTQVTRDECTHTVTQAYCSALPVGYSQHPSELWQPFAALVLEAAYEATLCAAILNLRNTGVHRVFLTLVGGGAFRNQPAWILDALERALRLYADWNLDVVMVSYGSSKPMFQELARKFS
jgi:hypothetical protein